MRYCLGLDLFVLFLWLFKTNCDINFIFLCFTAWLVYINNSGAPVFNMLAKSMSCGNICFFNQHYQPGKTTSQVLVVMIKYLVFVSFELHCGRCNICNIFGFNYCCTRNCDREKCYAYVVKRLVIYKGVVNSETRNFPIKGFYLKGLESILIGNGLLG